MGEVVEGRKRMMKALNTFTEVEFENLVEADLTCVLDFKNLSEEDFEKIKTKYLDEIKKDFSRFVILNDNTELSFNYAISNADCFVYKLDAYSEFEPFIGTFVDEVTYIKNHDEVELDLSEYNVINVEI